jgi:predicted AlkP superfamily phosphohydrolase/phosphomutase
MMIITPDGKVRKEEKEAASFLDVAPTILKTSGVNYDFKSDGLDLAGPVLKAGKLPLKGGSYDRALLFEQASATA